jgi:hypothetical protein
MLSGMVSNKVTGWGYFSTAVPGIDIVQSFYRNFAESVSPGGELSSFFGGMLNSSVALLEKGIPLEMHTALETKVLGKTVISGESMSGIYDVKLVNLPDDWCSRSFIDESNLTDIDAQLQQALSGASAGGAGGMSGGMPGSAPASGLPAGQAGGLGEMFGGLSAAAAGGFTPGSDGEMTPEEQAQMAQAVAGLGQMFGGLAGATAGAAGPANPAGAGSAGAVPASAAPTVARSAPSLSSALMTDNLTQSAQNMLGALGYDPGNTDGELSVATTIAISQFQAEQGLEVTGEVTPQLLGILAAQVDAL